MSNSHKPQCCGRAMLCVVGKHPGWFCRVCGAYRNLAGEPFTPAGGASFTPDSGVAESAPVTDYEPRCWKCGRVQGIYFSRPWSIKCHRCKAPNRRG